MKDLYLLSTRIIFYTLNDISIVLRHSLADSAGPFWWTEELKNVAIPDFENINLSLTESSVFLHIYVSPHFFQMHYINYEVLLSGSIINYSTWKLTE